MKHDITIIHLSDLHASPNNESEIKLRSKALFNDLQRLQITPDLIVFSGDAAHTGAAHDFRLANSLLFEPLKARLHCAYKRMIVVPGNHDVDRSAIDPLKEKGLRLELASTEAAQPYVDAYESIDTRLATYNTFAKTFSNRKRIYSTFIDEFAGIKVGLAGLNTAWRSASDADKHHLFLTSKQINAAADELSRCELAIAIFHHPLEWLHESELDVTINDLKRRFNILLNGHLHENMSVYEVSPTAKAIRITAPAFYSRDGKSEGYNIYTINPVEKTFLCDFRKFVRKRSAFDKNVDHAVDGRFEIELPIATVGRTAILVQRIGRSVSDVQEKLKEQLRLFQPTGIPILVTPKVHRLIWQQGTRREIPYRLAYKDVIEHSTFVYGEKEAGKTIFLESLVEQLNSASTTTGKRVAAFYIDYEDHSDKAGGHAGWLSFLKGWIAQQALGGDVDVVVAIDNLPDKTVELLEATISELETSGMRFVISVANMFLLDAVAASSGSTGCNFLRMAQWGPSRIREFTKRYFAGTAIDPEAAYLFVRRSLEDTDLPANPVIVSLYLSVFQKLGRNLTSLSFLNLLEHLEAMRLESDDAHTYSAYNKREILMRIAVLSHRRGELTVPRAEVEALILDFFEDKLLDVNVSRFIEVLVDSRLIISENGEVGFGYYVFFDYYLAKAFFNEVLDVNLTIQTIEDFLQYGNALAFLGGMSRADTRVLKRLFEKMVAMFAPAEPFALKELDSIMDKICDVEDLESNVDAATSKHIGARKTAEDEDPSFEKNKSAYRNRRRSLRDLVRSDGEIGELQRKFAALKTFYNLFRNLENIKGTDKVRYLSTALDYHIKCNLDFIRFCEKILREKRFSAYTAYLVTIAGQIFLAANIGNQTLKGTIEKTESETTNDFKKLLLILLYSDLRLPGYVAKIDAFLDGANSCAAIELVYAKAKALLLTFDGDTLPASLIGLFKTAFERKQKYYKGSISKALFEREYKELLKLRSDFSWRSDALSAG